MEQQSIIPPAKEERVRNIFNSIARKYDLTNGIMSLGIHNYWRKVLVTKAALPKGGLGLDLCCGTGLVTIDLASKAGPGGKVFGVDFSAEMLKIAKQRQADLPLKETIEFIQANALDLPFEANLFDSVTIAYGLRNVADLKQVLTEIKRVLKPGGKIASLEMSKPDQPVLKKLHEIYLSNWVPLLGRILVNNKAAYQYLHDSIQHYPHHTQITQLLSNLGFTKINCYQLSLGIATIHCGEKPA